MKRFLKLLSTLNRKYGHKLDHWWIGYLLCLSGFGITILAFYPGYMSPDSIANLTSGREGYYYDINSPVMSWLWGVLDTVYPGPAPMLILHNLIFWSGGAIFWRALKDRSAKLGICLILIGFMPQIISQLSTIWKDVGLTVCLFLVSSILFHSVQKKSKSLLLLTPVLLFYAYAARLNSFPAIIPMVIWTAFVIERVFSLNLTVWKRGIAVTLFSFIYFSVLTVAVTVVNLHLTQGRTVYPFQQVLLYDLAAISKGRDLPLFPEYILRGEKFSLENVKSEYDLRSINRLIYGDRPNIGDPPILKLSNDPEEIDALWTKWRETVLDNKSLYLSHRWYVFAQLVGFTRNSVTTPLWDPGFAENPSEFRFEPNLLNRVLTKYVSLFRIHFFFRGFFWLGLCVFFIYQSFKRRFDSDWEAVFFLSISAMLYTAAYFPTTPSTEFRYILWSELAAAVAAVFAGYLILKRQMDVNQAEPPPSPIESIG